MLKGLIIFGGGVYTGVYIAQNYQEAVNVVFKNGPRRSDKPLDVDDLEKVEDPMALFSKLSAAIQSTIDDISKKSK